MEKRQIAKKAALIASGAEPFLRLGRDARDSARRVKNIGTYIFTRAPALTPDGFSCAAYNPWAGRYIDENGDWVTVLDPAEMPGFKHKPGAQMGVTSRGNNFEELARASFTQDQLHEMATGKSIQRRAMATASVVAAGWAVYQLSILSIMPAVATLSVAFLFFSLTLEHDVTQRTVMDLVPHDLKSYQKRFGFLSCLRPGF